MIHAVHWLMLPLFAVSVKYASFMIRLKLVLAICITLSIIFLDYNYFDTDIGLMGVQKQNY